MLRLRFFRRVLPCLGLTLACLGGATLCAEAAQQAEIRGFETNKVTYLTLAPQVGLRGCLMPPAELRGTGQAVFTIRELTRQQTLACVLQPVTFNGAALDAATTLALRLDKMMGLLATLELRDEAGHVLARAERPFDVTSDLRTNWRYAGETYANIEKKLEPKIFGPGSTKDDFWSHIPVGTTPEQELDALYNCHLNVAQVSIDDDRGHYTCWEEGNRQFWTKSAYWALDFWQFGLERINKLYHGGDARGIYMVPWTDGKGLGVQHAQKDFPWIYKPNPTGYYPGSWQMNLDPAYKHPLSEAEKKLINIDTHGAESWLDYVIEELYRVSNYYQPRAIWWDNSHGTTHIPYTLDALRHRWAQQDAMRRPPILMINGDAGYNSDLYWIERDLPEKMDQYIGTLNTLILERPQVKDGAAVISMGQDHPRVGSGAQEAITSPDNPYNDPQYTFMYRQLLFEGIADDARIVHQQQWPRNALEWRILHFPEAFKDHAKTWGFQTLFEHVYNSRDIIPYRQLKDVRITNLPMTTEIAVEDNKLHLVARAPLSDPDTIYLHVFNYIGTTTQLHGKRPRPTPQENVALEVQTPGFAEEYRVQAFSPDFASYSACVTPVAKCHANKMEFSVPVENYTLIVINRRGR
jgi:hypothetical protein